MRRRVPVFLSINLLVLAPSAQQWAAGESPRIIEGGARCPSGDGNCPADGDAQSDGTAASPSPAPAIPSAPAASMPGATVPAPPPAAAPRDSRYALPLLGAYRKTMEIEDQIERACTRWFVPAPLAKAVCMYESGGDDLLTSGAGAHGYFQVMPSTFRMMHVATNIEAGVKYLGSLLSEFGREDDVLAAYNGGPGRVKKHRPMPIESLQYVIGVGIYRTLLTREEPRIREDAMLLDLHRSLPGETWQSLSETLGVPLIDLRLYNPCLAVRPLKPGAVVAFPRPGTFRHLGGAGEAGEMAYVTRRGDNYLLLAFAYDVDLDRFRKENTLWRVQPPFEGMKLYLNPRSHPAALGSAPSLLPPVAPQEAASGGAAGTAGTDAADGAAGSGPGAVSAPAVFHRVRPGDTLHTIARTYGVSIASLRKANKLKRSRLRVGQVLAIPSA